MIHHQQPLPRICGTEVEYGFLGTGINENVNPLLQYSEYLPEGLQHIGHYLSNGGRMYVDVGNHPEYATPEVSSFREAVIAEIAGELIMKQTLDAMVGHELKPDYRLHKRVTDNRYNLHGSHESYLTSREVDPDDGRVRNALALHFVTRSIFTGAGHFDGYQWHVTQKLGQLDEIEYLSSHTLGHRPIVDTRDEPLANESLYRRLHVTCGDANISPWAMWMKLGTTSLVLRLIEAGISLDNLALEEPLESAGIVAKDLNLSRTLRLMQGNGLTALAIQFELATRAKELARTVQLPSEEEEVIKEWVQACEDAASDIELLGDRVDWVKKRMVNESIAETKSEKFYLDNLAALDQTYDFLGSKTGQGIKLRNKGTFKMVPGEDEVKSAILRPPADTRAWLRGRLILAATQPIGKKVFGKPELVNWNEARFEHVRGCSMPNPRSNSHPIYDDLIDRVGI